MFAPARSKKETGPNAMRMHLQDNPSCWDAHHQPFDNEAGKSTFRCPGYAYPCGEVKCVFRTRELFKDHIEKCDFYKLAKEAADAVAAKRQEQSSAAVTSRQMPPPSILPPQRRQTWPPVRSNDPPRVRSNNRPQAQQRPHPAMSPLGSDRHRPALVAISAGVDKHQQGRALSKTERAARVQAANDHWSGQSSSFTLQLPVRRQTDPQASSKPSQASVRRPTTPATSTSMSMPVPVSGPPRRSSPGTASRPQSARSASWLRTKGKPTK